MKKRFLILTTVLALTMSSLAGCSSLNTSETVVTVNDTNETAGVANYLARFTQAQYETYYAAYLGENMWTTEAEEGKTYEQVTKESVLENLETMVLLEQHMDEYGVTLTDDEKKLITESATKLLEANPDDVNKKISATQESIERVLTLITVEEKMKDAIEAKVDTNVTDEEAAQKAMQYAQFAFTSTDAEGNQVQADDAAKAELKKSAESLAKADAKNFEKEAEKLGSSAVDVTFSADNTSYDEKLIAAADKLKKGEVSGVIEGADGYYVAVLTSEFDKEATEAQKENIVQERKNDLYEEVTTGWKEEAKITVNDKVWDKVSFVDLRVTMQEEEPEDEPAEADGGEVEVETVDDADASN